MMHVDRVPPVTFPVGTQTPLPISPRRQYGICHYVAVHPSLPYGITCTVCTQGHTAHVQLMHVSARSKEEGIFYTLVYVGSLRLKLCTMMCIYHCNSQTHVLVSDVLCY